MDQASAPTVPDVFVRRGRGLRSAAAGSQKLEAVQAELGELCHIIQGDVTAQGDRERMVAAAVAHGGGKLDALVNNAANMYRQPVDGYTEAFLQEAFNTNVISAMMLSSMVVPHLEMPLRALSYSSGRPTHDGRFREPRPMPRPRPRSRD